MNATTGAVKEVPTGGISDWAGDYNWPPFKPNVAATVKLGSRFVEALKMAVILETAPPC
jgi:hypothetical protein